MAGMRSDYSIMVPYEAGQLLVSCDVSFAVSEHVDLWLNRIFVPPPLRDRRWGSQALAWLCCDADAEGMSLGLGISPYGRLDYTQLDAWYCRYGFVFTPYEDEHGQWTYYRRDPQPHLCVWKYEDDEYGSLADGGSYEVYRCVQCRRRSYSPLPD